MVKLGKKSPYVTSTPRSFNCGYCSKNQINLIKKQIEYDTNDKREPFKTYSYINFDNILNNIDNISVITYQSGQDLINENISSNVIYPSTQGVINVNVSPNIPIQIYMAPNASRYVADPTLFIQRVQTLWAKNAAPISFNIFIFNSDQEDKMWVTDQLNNLNFQRFTHLVNNMNNSGNCDIDFKTGQAVALFNVLPENSYFNENQYTYGFAYSHECTHAYQHYQFRKYNNINDPYTYNQAFFNFLPCWYHEGQPNLAVLACSNSYENYIMIKNNNINNLSYQYPNFDPSKENILDLLLYQQPGVCYRNAGNLNSDYMLGYSIGMLVLEALAAIGGPQPTMDVIVNGSNNNNTFIQAFENIYKISWEKAAPILANVAAIQIANYRNAHQLVEK